MLRNVLASKDFLESQGFIQIVSDNCITKMQRTDLVAEIFPNGNIELSDGKKIEFKRIKNHKITSI